MHVASALTKPFRICVSKGKECESEGVHLGGRCNREERRDRREREGGDRDEVRERSSIWHGKRTR